MILLMGSTDRKINRFFWSNNICVLYRKVSPILAVIEQIFANQFYFSDRHRKIILLEYWYINISTQRSAL